MKSDVYSFLLAAIETQYEKWKAVTTDPAQLVYLEQLYTEAKAAIK